MTAYRFLSTALLTAASAVFVLFPAQAKAGKVTVQPGESIQAAIDSAAAGDTVLVIGSATPYSEATGAHGLVITKPLKLVGKKSGGLPPKIVAEAGQEDGILAEGLVGAPIDGLMIKGFLIEGFPRHGIHLRYVNNFKILKNESANNLENGIFPTLSTKGKVIKNIAYGTLDAGLWVEAAYDVKVQKNILYNNPTGLEITISDNVVAKGNEVYNNVVGIGMYHPNGASLPPDPVGVNWKISKNHVYDNNLPNPADPDSLVGALPTGGGILVLGVDTVMVDGNLVENNDYYGVALVDWCTAVAGTPNNCNDNEAVADQWVRNVTVKKNTFINNGTNPTSHPLEAFASDIISLTGVSGANNCIDPNVYSTSSIFGGGVTNNLAGDNPCP